MSLRMPRRVGLFMFLLRSSSTIAGRPTAQEPSASVTGEHIEVFSRKTFGTRKSFAVFRKFDGSTRVEVLFRKNFGDDYAGIERSCSKYVMSLIPLN
jgi:hypothetical protein